MNPTLMMLIILAANAAALLAYFLDKRAAAAGASRIPESTLLMLALLGGWPASLYAQRKFRHKTKKASFQIKFRLICVISVVGMVYLAAR